MILDTLQDTVSGEKKKTTQGAAHYQMLPLVFKIL